MRKPGPSRAGWMAIGALIALVPVGLATTFVLNFLVFQTCDAESNGNLRAFTDCIGNSWDQLIAALPMIGLAVAAAAVAATLWRRANRRRA